MVGEIQSSLPLCSPFAKLTCLLLPRRDVGRMSEQVADKQMLGEGGTDYLESAETNGLILKLTGENVFIDEKQFAFPSYVNR